MTDQPTPTLPQETLDRLELLGASKEEVEARWHRLRHYPGRWSTFDLIDKCTKPKFCCGCEFKHPFCTESGIVAAATSSTAGEVGR